MNPLVLRARNGRWWTTTAAYIASSIVGGAIAGWLLAALGAVLRAHTNELSWATDVAVLGICGLVGALVDAGIGGLRLPTIGRQVNEEWRYRYRNWIYAIGYGFQIGLGFTTIVTTAAVYATFVAAFLLASPMLGLVVGAWFGLARSASVLTVGRVRTIGQFESIEAGLNRMYEPGRVLTIVGQGALGIALVALTVL